MNKGRIALVLLICTTTVFRTVAESVEKPSHVPSGRWQVLDGNLKSRIPANTSVVGAKPLPTVQGDCGQTKLAQSVASPIKQAYEVTESPNVTNQRNQYNRTERQNQGILMNQQDKGNITDRRNQKNIRDRQNQSNVSNKQDQDNITDRPYQVNVTDHQIHNNATDQEIQDNVTDQQNQKNVKTVQKLVNFLSRRLTKVIGGKDNIFFSPFSLSVSLAMVYLGAGGTTANEMEQSLGYKRILGNTSLQNIHDDFHHTLSQMKNSSGEYKLLVANGMFIQTKFNIRPEFTNELKRQYSAKVMFLDFANNGEKAVEEINNWTSNNTQGKIRKLLDKSLDSATMMALLNAVYFKGSWTYPFSSKNTRSYTFYNADGTTTVTQFLSNKKRVLYFKDDKLGYNFLSLPYKGSNIAMLFVLPQNPDQFPDIDVTTKLMNYVRKNLQKATVLVMIPKFKLSYNRELTHDMHTLGIVNLFSEQNANLTGMRTENDLFLSILVHQAVIDVNEEGTEAAAATGMSFTSRSGYSSFKVFKADHPFLFCIYDKQSGTILFMGRLSNL